MKAKKKTMKGVSELIVIITILLVAVVAVFAFRAWVAGQQQRMSNIDMATATYSVQYTQSGNTIYAIISLLVRNNLLSNISVTNATIVLSDGTILYPGYSSGSITVTPSSISISVGAKSDALITIRITGLNPSSTPIRDVNVLVQDPSTGQSQWIKAVGG